MVQFILINFQPMATIDEGGSIAQVDSVRLIAECLTTSAPNEDWSTFSGNASSFALQSGGPQRGRLGCKKFF